MPSGPPLPIRTRIEQALASGWSHERICEQLHVTSMQVAKVLLYLEQVNAEPETHVTSRRVFRQEGTL